MSEVSAHKQGEHPHEEVQHFILIQIWGENAGRTVIQLVKRITKFV